MNQKFKNKEKIFKHLEMNNDCCFVNEIYLIIFSNDIKRLSSRKWDFLGINCIFFFSVFLSWALLLSNLLYKKIIDYNKDLAIARVHREKYKIANVCGEIQFIEDDIKNYDFTIYRIGSRYSRLKFLIKSYIPLCIKEYKRIKEILKVEHLSPYSTLVLLMCVKRIPHTVIYKQALDYILCNYRVPNLYIGSTLERFALIAEDISKKYNKKLICIPHGVETTEKMPRCYVGDVFYCSSLEMASKLNGIYETLKFIFDNKVVRKMYQVKDVDKVLTHNRKKKVVFFTQPLYVEQEKKIIRFIAEYLQSRNQKLYIKIHPLENSSNYMINNTEIIENFSEAIISNICISISSTVLLEAIYNNSASISIIHLVNEEAELIGYNEFLCDPRILKPNKKFVILEMIENLIM